MKKLIWLFLFLSVYGCISKPRERTYNQNGRSDLNERSQRSESRNSSNRIRKLIEIPFFHENGVLHIRASINGSPIKFVFDSGASDVTISVTEASHLLKNGFLGKDDFTGKQNYVDANGDVNVGVTFNIAELTLGEVKLNSVQASVVNSKTASNLLGQSALARFGKVSIDYNNNEIILNLQ
jgi:aspartyl protease family protein